MSSPLSLGAGPCIWLSRSQYVAFAQNAVKAHHWQFPDDCCAHPDEIAGISSQVGQQAGDFFDRVMAGGLHETRSECQYGFSIVQLKLPLPLITASGLQIFLRNTVSR